MAGKVNETATQTSTPNVIGLEERRPGLSVQAMRVLSGMVSRLQLGRLTSFGGKRDYGSIFGWDDVITPEKMMYMYNRGGIAKRLVDAYPDANWARPPEIWADGDDAWTKAWETLLGEVDVWGALHRLDRLAALGHYAVMLIGTDRPGLEMPLRNPTSLSFLQPYGELSAKITKWDKDRQSENYGRPAVYRIYPDNLGSGLTLSNSNGVETAGTTRSSFLVHHSRILHVARGSLEDDVYGQPLMAPSWDYLTDLRKVVGSSSESYWISANRGMQADVDKEMTLNSGDEAALQDEIDDFFNGFRRFVRTKGVELKTLDNQLADPKNPFDVLVTLISGTSGIPKRILLGSEAGQLASTQDKGNWAERLEEERSLHSEPKVLRPFIRKLISAGLLPKLAEGAKLRTLWPDAYRMSPLERGQTSAQTARTLANIVRMLDSEKEETRNLLSREELRALLGFSSDNRILEDDPSP